MRRIFVAAALAASLVLGGCAGTRLGDAIQFATATVDNPATITNIYQVKNAYAAGLELAVAWRSYCWSAPYRALMADPVGKRLCRARRPIARMISASDEKAFFAISEAENFIRMNPTLSAVTLIRAAAKAVSDYRNIIPAK